MQEDQAAQQAGVFKGGIDLQGAAVLLERFVIALLLVQGKPQAKVVHLAGGLNLHLRPGALEVPGEPNRPPGFPSEKLARVIQTSKA